MVLESFQNSFLPIKHEMTAVKRLPLVWTKSEQFSKMCFIIKRSSHSMHSGVSSPFNKKESWKNDQRAIRPSQSLLLCLSEDKQCALLDLEILYVIYCPGTHPISEESVPSTAPLWKQRTRLGHAGAVGIPSNLSTPH